ncbi:MAG: signal transduction histidine kinase/CheY-like chemotaxis protein, partial [Planctomycetota bacterium]
QVPAYDIQNLFDPQRVTVPLQGALTQITALLGIANAATSNQGRDLADSDRIAYLVSLDESFKLRLEILSTNIIRLISAINNYIDELAVYDTSASYPLRTTELVTELEALVQNQLRQIVNQLEQSIRQSKQGLITSSINSQHFYFVLSMFSILISLIIAFFLGNLITGSILTLQEAAREFSAGNLRYRIDEPESREFAEVIQVFNQMAESVQQDQVRLRQNLAKLNEANRELDSRVESRTRELETAMLHATRANRAKSQFLSSMSHELRTPLNAILGFSQLFRYGDNLTEKQHGNAQKINQAGTHLLNLVDQVLDLSRIETGDFDLSFKAVNVVDILQESVVWVNKQAHTRRIVINFDPEPYRSLYVRADALRFRQIILNLLSNAIKYNREKGEIHILLHQKDDLRLGIGIKDTGAGIPSHLLGDLFQPFNRLGAEASATEGTGIGLVISKKLARLMRGDISVETVSGKGSTFWLELQTVEPSEAPTRPISSSIHSNLSVFKAHRKKIKVLVAEDMTVNQELMEAQLDFLGYSSRFARNGAEALEVWKKGEHQILLTDIRMPVMDGVELTQQIRLLEKNSANPFPIIAVTANAMNVDANRYFDAGINAIITKPVILEELDSVLEDWLAGYG